MYIAGKLITQVQAGAPNNGQGESTTGRVKQFRRGNKIHTYVSAQAWRRWLRDTISETEPTSPVTRSGTGAKQQAYTSGNPVTYLDDDLFGYMIALKKNEGSIQRETVLKTSPLVSIQSLNRVPEDFGTMSRDFPHDASPVLHSHEFYSADLESSFLLDAEHVGVFEYEGYGIRPNLTVDQAKNHSANGLEDGELRGRKAIRLPVEERRRRLAVLLEGIANIRGGAKQAAHYEDHTPSMVLLAPLKGGVNPFKNVFSDDRGETQFNVDVFLAELEAWEDQIDGEVIVGWNPGYLSEQYAAALPKLQEAGIIVKHPREALISLANKIRGGELDGWLD